MLKLIVDFYTKLIWSEHLVLKSTAKFKEQNDKMMIEGK